MCWVQGSGPEHEGSGTVLVISKNGLPNYVSLETPSDHKPLQGPSSRNSYFVESLIERSVQDWSPKP